MDVIVQLQPIAHLAIAAATTAVVLQGRLTAAPIVIMMVVAQLAALGLGLQTSTIPDALHSVVDIYSTCVVVWC